MIQSELHARRQTEIPFDDSDFKQIAELAKRRFGLNIQPAKKPLVYSRLSRRLRQLNLPSFAAYFKVLSDAENVEETHHLLSALTTNVTHFFREMHHFDFFSKRLAPKLIAAAKRGEPVRIWSAACSAGQEAFSIAAVLANQGADLSNLDIRILGTDIDKKMIEIALVGTYSADQKSAIPQGFHGVMLESQNDPKKMKMAVGLKNIITFSELNLMDSWPMRKKFDVIFCRNAAIYFDKPTQANLWLRFADQLKDGGHLMIGHSERIGGKAMEIFESVGVTTYQKTTAL